MINKLKNNRKNITMQIQVPGIYVQSLNQGTKYNDITLESLIKLGRSIGLNVKDILINYSVIVIFITYGAQAKLNAKLNVPRKSESSPEKVFQQTETHSKTVKALSNSIASRELLSLIAVNDATRKDQFGLTEEECESDDAALNAISCDYTVLATSKGGSGTTKIFVRDPETRQISMRAKCASIRSKWCSVITFTPVKVASSGTNVKTLTPEQLFGFLSNLFNRLLAEQIIQSDEQPTIDDVKDAINKSIVELNITEKISDDIHGTFTFIPLETILGFKRIAIQEEGKANRIKPSILDSFK